MTDTEHKYTHAFLCIPNIGSETLKALDAHFEGIEQAWFASPTDIQTVSTIKPKKRDEIIAGKKRVNPDKEWEQFLSQNMRILTIKDTAFPSLLREIPDTPYTLYTKGSFNWTKPVPMIAIVGARKFTAYGEQVATKLAEDLTHAGLLVVSGLAFGIDSVSHKAALEAGGETIAVLGSGLASISPASHIPLAKKIIAHGALISEYPPLMGGEIWTFPARNRIIAGMTLGTIVIEAAEKSGSLITAKLALEYNREVFAVPGSIFSPYSIGTNALIKRGAKLITSVQDILEELKQENIFTPSQQTLTTKALESFSPDEQKLLKLLSHEPLHIDKIIKATTLETAQVSSLLALLEIKGLAKNVGGMHYVRTQV